VETFAALKFCVLRTRFCRDTAGDSKHRNGRTIFAPLIFVFTYLPAKIKGVQKFRGLQYAGLVASYDTRI